MSRDPPLAHLTPYDFRRGTTNRWAMVLLDGDRRVLSGYFNPGSDSFERSYKSKDSIVDVQGIAAERGQDAARIELFVVSSV